MRFFKKRKPKDTGDEVALAMIRGLRKGKKPPFDPKQYDLKP